MTGPEAFEAWWTEQPGSGTASYSTRATAKAAFRAGAQAERARCADLVRAQVDVNCTSDGITAYAQGVCKVLLHFIEDGETALRQEAPDE